MSQWAVADWAEMLEHKLKRLFAGQRFSSFGGAKARGVTLRSTKKNHQWSYNKWWKIQPTRCGRFDSWDVNISFFLGQPQSSDNAKKKGLDVTLNDPVVQYTQMGHARWSDVSAWFIKAVNYVLNHLDFEVR